MYSLFLLGIDVRQVKSVKGLRHMSSSVSGPLGFIKELG
jgi:hypothetical protein